MAGDCFLVKIDEIMNSAKYQNISSQNIAASAKSLTIEMDPNQHGHACRNKRKVS